MNRWVRDEDIIGLLLAEKKRLSSEPRALSRVQGILEKDRESKYDRAKHLSLWNLFESYPPREVLLWLHFFKLVIQGAPLSIRESAAALWVAHRALFQSSPKVMEMNRLMVEICQKMTTSHFVDFAR